MAGLLDVPAHVLRFWETRFAQVKPVKRSGGRRYYRPDDIVLLKRIRSLLYEEGYTIKGAQQVLRDKSAGRPAPPDGGAKDAPGPASGDVARALGLLRQASERLARL